MEILWVILQGRARGKQANGVYNELISQIKRLIILYIQLDQTIAAYGKLRKLAKDSHENIPLRPLSDFEYEGRDATQTLMSKS